MKNYIVIQRTGFIPYVLYTWDGQNESWIAQRAFAKLFTAGEARRVANKLNAKRPGAIIPAEVVRLP